MNCAPNRLTTTGGTRVQFIRRRRAIEGLDRLLRRHLREQPVLRAVDQFEFLALFDRLDGQPQLLGDLIVRAGVQVGDPSADIQQRGDVAQRVFAGAGLIVDEGLRQRRVEGGALLCRHGDLFGVDHTVHPVDTGFHRDEAE
jgi:hypothetical protein